MFAILGYLMFALLLIAAGVVLLARRRPDDFTITRAGNIPAPPEAVFALLSDFHNWTNFSPWEAMDPAMQRSFTGAENGVGAGYAWNGNKKVGRGSMLITAAEAGKSLLLDLNFDAPMKAQNTTRFSLNAVDQGTHLTWSMSGKNALSGKIFGLLFNIDKMVGRDFERGIDNIRAHFTGKA